MSKEKHVWELLSYIGRTERLKKNFSNVTSCIKMEGSSWTIGIATLSLPLSPHKQHHWWIYSNRIHALAHITDQNHNKILTFTLTCLTMTSPTRKPNEGLNSLATKIIKAQDPLDSSCLLWSNWVWTKDYIQNFNTHLPDNNLHHTGACF